VEKVAIIVLNYLNYKDTIECVESIPVDQYPAKEIIIVDNGSINDSRDRLEEKYKNCDGIHLVFSDQNGGFARGNNLGICYATNILGCSFVLLVNNDTLFKDPRMITTLMEAYEPGVGVLGPRILTADGHEQNPAKLDVIRSKWHQYWHYWCRIKKVQFKQSRFYQILRNIFKKRRTLKIKRNELAFINIISLNMVLHGSCLMLTKDYFTYYPWLFPNTFLYFEEEILTILTHKADLAKKFVHTTYIFHKEHRSTEMSFSNDKSVRKGYFLQSLKMAKKIYPLDYKVLLNNYFYGRIDRT